MIDWDVLWKIEKYPMWIKDGEIGKYWDDDASERYNSLVSTKDAVKNTLKQIEDFKLKKDDVVLDIGCGVGRLSIPIAKIVKKVYALDISSAMLNYVKKYAESENVDNIEIIQENWEEFDISKIGKVDVAISYNSMGVYELRKSLQKISEITKRDVFVFTFAGKGEWMDEKIAEIVYGKNILLSYSSALIMYNLLFQMGIIPDIHIEKNMWKQTYSSVEEACDSIISLYSINESLKSRVRDFVQKNCSLWDDNTCILYQKRLVACIHWSVSKHENTA